MKYAFTISRIVLGLIFVVFGLNGFLHFIPSRQFAGDAGQFIGAIFHSHFYIVVFLTQVVGGLLLLANRYVPFGLLLLGPVIINILSFHLLMSAPGLPLALFATALWLILFFQVRRVFSGVFVQRFPGASMAESLRFSDNSRSADSSRSKAA
jgi:putative oxidoreductase